MCSYGLLYSEKSKFLNYNTVGESIANKKSDSKNSRVSLRRTISGCSWGRYPKSQQYIRKVSWRDQLSDAVSLAKDSGGALAYGRGRSYGDACLNSTGELVDVSSVDRVISFDRERGILTAEAGITLRQILEVIVPAGWFLPVTPGTSWVTLGGAIANDVHGKNHHGAGTFGCHVLGIELLRAGQIETVSRNTSSTSTQPSLFNATIAGLGLTGIITTATIQLLPISSHRIVGESIRFESLDEFLELSSSSDTEFAYTVAWLDCLWSGGVRGHFMRGNHEECVPNPDTGESRRKITDWTPKWELLGVPLDVPNIFVKPWTMHCFNFAYYNRQRAQSVSIHQAFESFFYPLDAVSGWNKLYGARGFFQFQCVVPHAAGEPGIRAVIDCARKSGAGSFLAVLKEFGGIPSPGMLSFPRSGYTLCLDFANQGAETIALMQRLEAITMEHGGALYPAKDALMSAAAFKKSFPRLDEFAKFIEPGFTSDFWRRVTT